MALTTRNKAPARWAVLLISGLASAGFLWGIVNAPGSADATDTAAVAPPTPTAVQQVSRQRFGGDDDDRVVIAPSRQAPTTVQLSQSSQPAVRTSRFRTRGS